MKHSHNSNEERPMAGKQKPKTSVNQTASQRDRKDKEGDRPTQKDLPTVTEEQYRARVSQKAYELYEKRQGTTQVEDWLEAERLVKTELLAEGQWAATVLPMQLGHGNRCWLRLRDVILRSQRGTWSWLCLFE
jgi:hypothetical protein